MENLLWTQSKARLKLTSASSLSFNWLFLAGGPGLGSESLYPLTKDLKLPGTIWHLDLPGDGSNLTENNSKYFSKWQEALIEAVNALKNVILVGHSTGGMYALSTPPLEDSLKGLVLMDSAPDASWQEMFGKYMEQHPIPEMQSLHEEYSKNPSNELLKKITILSAPYIFTENGLKKDLSFLESLPYNFETVEWSAKHFDTSYKANWIPKDLPTLIFTGAEDVITPFSLFNESIDFQSPYIIKKLIKNAGHFPWIENLEEVQLAFQEYCVHLMNFYGDSVSV